MKSFIGTAVTRQLGARMATRTAPIGIELQRLGRCVYCALGERPKLRPTAVRSMINAIAAPQDVRTPQAA